LTPEHYVPARPAGYRLTHSASRDLFPYRRVASSHRPSPGSFDPGSFSRVASPLRSSFARHPCRSFRSCRPARVSSLSAASPIGVHSSCRHARQRYVPSTGFLNLSTACSTDRLRGLVASRSHAQGSFRSGASPDPKPSWLIASACLPAVIGLPLTGIPAAMSARLGFEALLPGSKRSTESLFRLPRGRSPLRIQPPSGSALPR